MKAGDFCFLGTSQVTLKLCLSAALIGNMFFNAQQNRFINTSIKGL
jgi:hypothetical protein